MKDMSEVSKKVLECMAESRPPREKPVDILNLIMGAKSSVSDAYSVIAKEARGKVDSMLYSIDVLKPKTSNHYESEIDHDAIQSIIDSMRTHDQPKDERRYHGI